MLVPLMLCFMVFALSGLNSLRKPWSARGFNSWKEFVVLRSVSLLLLIVGTMYTFLLVSAISPFKCINSETYYVLFDLPGVRCFDDQWYGWFPAVIFFLLFYGFFLPGILICIFHKNKHNIHEDSFKRLFGNFIRPFKEQYFWWGLTSVFKRTSFATAVAMMKLQKTEVLTVFVSMLILCIFLWVEIRVNPFKEESKFHLSAVYVSCCSKSLIDLCVSRANVVEIIVLMSNLVFQNSAVSFSVKGGVGIVMILVVVGLVLAGISEEFMIRFKQMYQTPNGPSQVVMSIGVDQTPPEIQVKEEAPRSASLL
jgi:hypothetical protein